jgi:hypothetical protein
VPKLGHLLREWLSRLAHDLGAQAQGFLGPSSTPSVVAGIDPQLRKVPKAIARRIQQQPDAVFVGYLSVADPRLEHQSFGVHQQVTLSPFDLLARIEAALCASHSRGPD